MTKRNVLFGFMIAGLMLSGCTEADGAVNVEAAVSDQIEDVAEKPATGEDYRVVTEESNFGWEASKVVATHFGKIEISTGQLFINEGEIVSGNFKIDMTSITNEDLEDEGMKEKFLTHMKSADFFDVENHPSATFQISEVKESSEEGATHVVTGNLTIKGTTKAISFPANIEFGEDKVTAKAKFEVDRTQWDIVYGSGKFFQGLGDNLIDDMFTVDLDIVAEKA